MTQDRSPDFKCTKKFVQDSLENAEKFKQAAVSVCFDVKFGVLHCICIFAHSANQCM